MNCVVFFKNYSLLALEGENQLSSIHYVRYSPECIKTHPRYVTIKFPPLPEEMSEKSKKKD